MRKREDIRDGGGGEIKEKREARGKTEGAREKERREEKRERKKAEGVRVNCTG